MSGALRSGGSDVESSAPSEPSAAGNGPGDGQPLARVKPRIRSVIGWLLAGVLVGALWRVLTPAATGWAENYERGQAGDVVLAGVEAGAGILTAVLGLLRPGPGAAGRFGLAIVGAAMASAVAWSTGTLLRAPRLAMPAVLLLWPLSTAVVTVLVTLAATLVVRNPYGD